MDIEERNGSQFFEVPYSLGNSFCLFGEHGPRLRVFSRSGGTGRLGTEVRRGERGQPRGSKIDQLRPAFIGKRCGMPRKDQKIARASSGHILESDPLAAHRPPPKSSLISPGDSGRLPTVTRGEHGSGAATACCRTCEGRSRSTPWRRRCSRSRCSVSPPRRFPYPTPTSGEICLTLKRGWPTIVGPEDQLRRLAMFAATRRRIHTGQTILPGAR